MGCDRRKNYKISSGVWHHPGIFGFTRGAVAGNGGTATNSALLS